jgi:HEAT repeat protein
MYKDPDLPTPRVVEVFPEKVTDLWVRALGRPEPDLRRQAADAVAVAHRRGADGLTKTVEPLVKIVDREDEHPAVRLAAARALVELDARDAAESLFRQAQAGDADLREVVEPALARWDYRPARAAWLARLRDPAAPRRKLVLAMQGLAAVGEGEAVDRLREIVRSDAQPGPVRVEAARALGALRGEGLEEDAERLLADATPRGVPARLAAAALLRRHKGEAAVRLLQRLAEDTEPAVAAPAVARLLEIDPDLAVPAVERFLANPDAHPRLYGDATLRSYAVEVLHCRPTGEHVRDLADRLDDADPEVRAKARRFLEGLAVNPELRDRVLTEATRVLEEDRDWRGQEQAAVLLARLDHKPAAGRLVNLLSADRAEVGVAAAWALRRLAVPDTLEAVAAHVEAVLNRNETPDLTDYRVAQLNQLLGQQKYQKAEGLLRRFIPRRPDASLPESRAAAIWALGLLHEGEAVPALAKDLEARLNDTKSLPPEDDRVRWMAAAALGRMKAKQTLDSLKANCPDHEPSFNPVNNACGWAMEQITGEAFPPPKTIRTARRDWFLVPDK